MREILFRGKHTRTGEWVEGLLWKKKYNDNKLFISCFPDKDDNEEIYIIIPETVGQYTGLTDKNGKKIFEGDIVKAQDDVFGSPFCNGIVGTVTFEETAFFIETPNIIDTQYLFNECAVYEVIGNIHDNPELLKGE